MYDMIQTGNRIRECRLSQKITQEQAAEALSISLKHYSEIERGITGLSFDIFTKICHLYSCSSDYLLFGSSQIFPASLSEAYAKCSPARQASIRKILEELLQLPE